MQAAPAALISRSRRAADSASHTARAPPAGEHARQHRRQTHRCGAQRVTTFSGDEADGDINAQSEDEDDGTLSDEAEPVVLFAGRAPVQPAAQQATSSSNNNNKRPDQSGLLSPASLTHSLLPAHDGSGVFARSTDSATSPVVSVVRSLPREEGSVSTGYSYDDDDVDLDDDVETEARSLIHTGSASSDRDSGFLLEHDHDERASSAATTTTTSNSSAVHVTAPRPSRLHRQTGRQSRERDAEDELGALPASIYASMGDLPTVPSPHSSSEPSPAFPGELNLAPPPHQLRTSQQARHRRESTSAWSALSDPHQRGATSVSDLGSSWALTEEALSALPDETASPRSAERYAAAVFAAAETRGTRASPPSAVPTDSSSSSDGEGDVGENGQREKQRERRARRRAVFRKQHQHHYRQSSPSPSVTSSALLPGQQQNRNRRFSRAHTLHDLDVFASPQLVDAIAEQESSRIDLDHEEAIARAPHAASAGIMPLRGGSSSRLRHAAAAGGNEAQSQASSQAKKRRHRRSGRGASSAKRSVTSDTPRGVPIVNDAGAALPTARVVHAVTAGKQHQQRDAFISRVMERLFDVDAETLGLLHGHGESDERPDVVMELPTPSATPVPSSPILQSQDERRIVSGQQHGLQALAEDARVQLGESPHSRFYLSGLHDESDDDEDDDGDDGGDQTETEAMHHALREHPHRSAPYSGGRATVQKDCARWVHAYAQSARQDVMFKDDDDDDGVEAALAGSSVSTLMTSAISHQYSPPGRSLSLSSLPQYLLGSAHDGVSAPMSHAPSSTASLSLYDMSPDSTTQATAAAAAKEGGVTSEGSSSSYWRRVWRRMRQSLSADLGPTSERHGHFFIDDFDAADPPASLATSSSSAQTPLASH